MSFVHRSFFVFLTCACHLVTAGQIITNDTTFVSTSVDSILSIHKERLAENLRLYNGTPYTVPYIGAKGHPYFESDSMQSGSVHYDGALYKDVPLLYDLLSDEVIIQSYDRQGRFKLQGEKLNYFVVDGHFFVRLLRDSTHGAIMKTGFYDLLYDKNMTVFVRREMLLQQVAGKEGIDARFVPYTYYYIKQNGVYNEIASTSTLLKIFSDKKNAVKSYLRKNKLKFKINPEETIVKAVIYSEQNNL